MRMRFCHDFVMSNAFLNAIDEWLDILITSRWNAKMARMNRSRRGNAKMARRTR